MKARIDNFRNGIRDDVNGNANDWFERLDNVEINSNGGLDTRPGQQLYPGIAALGSKITNLFFLEDGGTTPSLYAGSLKKVFKYNSAT